MKMDYLDWELVVIGIMVVIFIGILFIGAYDKGASLDNIEYTEGEISSINDIKRNVVYIIDNETFTCWGLPIDNVSLNQPCKIHYGFTPIVGKKIFIRIEYLEDK